MGVHNKLFLVQQSLKAPKDQFNSFGKYKYRSCENVLEALKPLLLANQMVVTLSDAVKEIGGRVYIEATATVIDIETGESYSTTAFAREEAEKKGMDSSQVTGACSSYARKYALNGLFAIDDQKDSDATNDRTADGGKESGLGNYPQETKKAQEAPTTVAQESFTSKAYGMLQCDEEGDYIICSECNGKIRDQKKKNGETYRVPDYVAACLKTYGKPICTACRKKHGTTA